MIILKLKGGLGNQLFQYAYALNLSYLTRKSIVIDSCSGFENDFYKRKYVLNKFQITTINKLYNHKSKNNWLINKVSRIYDLLFRSFINRKYINEVNFHFDKKLLKINRKKEIHVEGYFQSYKYFDEISSEIKDLYKLQNKYKSKDFYEFENKIKNSDSVAVHIRDYSLNGSNNDDLTYKSCSSDFYKKSVDLIKNKFKNPLFFIFSDNLNFAKSVYPHINSNSIFVSNLSDCEDLTLMSYCNHNIISNSSFSWWGAWLNLNKNKIVIGPEEWFLDKNKTTKDLYPDSWIKIRNN